jgi:hypothetical protein
MDKHLKEEGEVCDFCGQQPTPWVHWTKPASVNLPIGLCLHLSPDWAVCSACHEFILAEDRQGLRKRSEELFKYSYLGQDMPRELDEATRQHPNPILDAFWENRTGRFESNVTDIETIP